MAQNWNSNLEFYFEFLSVSPIIIYIDLCNNTSLIECNEIFIVINTNIRLYLSVQ